MERLLIAGRVYGETYYYENNRGGYDAHQTWKQRPLREKELLKWQGKLLPTALGYERIFWLNDDILIGE